ncbi:hypothetical protein [Chryseobacterium arthrosphaerae]|uniref:hypothetical protein n=1 Tax=Chryseobacterium arthrosphaerae TaxID=651561 RepID=UPI001BAE9617|nr:hypothetical protein [Chryseobacterium arthrosphaerae]QUY54593.1 hypothetical protein I2F65_17140 [Chryseobacterium arthrosphaerae]
MTLKIKNYFIVFFRITLSLFSFSLPFVFTKGAYQNMISKGHYLWFSYFILIFLFMIYLVGKKNYYELIRAKIQNENLVYYNFLLIKKALHLKDILGYKNGIDDDGNEFISLFNNQNRKIATLKVNIYSNLPEFVESLHCEHIGYELTSFQNVIEKIKKLFTNT